MEEYSSDSLQIRLLSDCSKREKAYSTSFHFGRSLLTTPEKTTSFYRLQQSSFYDYREKAYSYSSQIEKTVSQRKRISLFFSTGIVVFSLFLTRETLLLSFSFFGVYTQYILFLSLFSLLLLAREQQSSHCLRIQSIRCGGVVVCLRCKIRLQYSSFPSLFETVNAQSISPPIWKYVPWR